MTPAPSPAAALTASHTPSTASLVDASAESSASPSVARSVGPSEGRTTATAPRPTATRSESDFVRRIAANANDPPTGWCADPWVVLGPTASGKSALAMELARRHEGTQLFCVDSMTVYRGMDIGTAKPTGADQAEVRHHLLDLVEPTERFTVVDMQRAHAAALDSVAAGSDASAAPPSGSVPLRRALLVGGAGLYLRAVVDQLTVPPEFPDVVSNLACEPTEALFERLERLDPVAAARTVPTNRRRLLRALEVTIGSGRPFSSFGPGLTEYPPVPHRMFGVHIEADALEERIEQRFHQQLDDGFVAEVEALLDRGLGSTAAQSLGYRELAAHLRGELTLQRAIETAITGIRRFARRQQRWFNRDPRITWLNHETPSAMADQVKHHLAERSTVAP